MSIISPSLWLCMQSNMLSLLCTKTSHSRRSFSATSWLLRVDSDDIMIVSSVCTTFNISMYSKQNEKNVYPIIRPTWYVMYSVMQASSYHAEMHRGVIIIRELRTISADTFRSAPCAPIVTERMAMHVIMLYVSGRSDTVMPVYEASTNMMVDKKHTLATHARPDQ